jgi:ribonuclease HII
LETNFETLRSKSLAELRTRFLLKDQPVPPGLLEALERDPRRGAQQLSVLLGKRSLRNRRESQRLSHLLFFEKELWAQGVRLIAGVDEAGMAPLAGPVVAAAVIIPQNYKLVGLDDSKKITSAHRRRLLAAQIKQNAVCWATGQAEVEEIDALNIYHSGLLAMRRAVEALTQRPDYLLVDARTIPHCALPQKGIVHGDALSASIAAASLIAKTTRDAYMIDLDRIYPGYGFASHKGYPTPEHLRALRERGPLPVHRKSFAPVREVLGTWPIQRDLFPGPIERPADFLGKGRSNTTTKTSKASKNEVF